MPNDEAGHAKNVENFQHLVAFVTGYGTAYFPSNPKILPVSLSNLLNSAAGALEVVDMRRPAYTVAVNRREDAFAELPPLLGRVINELKESGAADSVLKDAEIFYRKTQGGGKSAA